VWCVFICISVCVCVMCVCVVRMYIRARAYVYMCVCVDVWMRVCAPEMQMVDDVCGALCACVCLRV